MGRDEVIEQICKDYKTWTSPIHLLMGTSVGKKDGYKLTRMALMDSVLQDDLGNLDALLTKAVDGDPEIDAVLCRITSILLHKLAETEPPPLKWFPKELAMLASSKLLAVATARPARHRGTNAADYASRDFFLIKSVQFACNALKLDATRNEATKAYDSGCSIVAEAMGLKEGAVDEVWTKRSRFGIA
jgi:hypothetical protein